MATVDTYEETLGNGYYEYPALKGLPSHITQAHAAETQVPGYTGDPRKPNDGSEFPVAKGLQPGIDLPGIPPSSM